MMWDSRDKAKATSRSSEDDSKVSPTGWENGLYALRFTLEGHEEQEDGEALVVLRDGIVLGSDRYGGVFEGQIAVTGCGTFSCLAMTLLVPPGGVLVTGHRGGEDEAAVDVVGVLSNTAGKMSGVCDVLGERLAVQFRYVGMLPN